MPEANIVVLGAGVIGLTSALLLSRDHKHNVTVIAEFMPGDQDIGYCSSWAGANYMPVSLPDTDLNIYERETWPELERLARELPEAGVHFQKCTNYTRNIDASSPIAKWQGASRSPRPWYMSTMPDAHILPASSLPPGIDSAQSYTSVCINTALYLPWLASQCLRHGVILKRGRVEHIADAVDSHASGRRADIVVNCTGLGARQLGGVEDQSVVPARGQIVVVRNEPGEMMAVSGCDDGPEECTYIMQRAAGGGTVLGGCYQKDSANPNPDPALALRIMHRCIALCPSLALPSNGGLPGKSGIDALSIIRHGVGLRPVREGGPRVAREVVGGTRVGGGQTVRGVRVVHCYGHGGAGYQSSWGSCFAAVRLVGQSLGREGGGERARARTRARL